MEALYPFLYSGSESNLDSVLAEVRQSTVAKAREITELRQRIAGQDSARLVSCAQQMASRFAAGGRLLAFGNGGSATDAQELATLFLNPGAGKRPLPAFCLDNDTAGADRAVQRHWRRGGVRPAARGVRAPAGHCGRAVHQRQFGEPAARARGGRPPRHADRGHRRVRRAQDGRLDALDYLFVAPSASVHRIQEAQTTVYHLLWELTLMTLPGGQ